MARLKKEGSKCTKPEKWSVICMLAVSENFTSISTIVRLDFRYVPTVFYVFVCHSTVNIFQYFQIKKDIFILL